MRIFFLAGIICISCGQNETEKRNAYMSELIAKKTQLEREQLANKALIRAQDTAAVKLPMDSLYSLILITGSDIDRVQKQIDSLSLLR